MPNELGCGEGNLIHVVVVSYIFSGKLWYLAVLHLGALFPSRNRSFKYFDKIIFITFWGRNQLFHLSVGIKY